MKTKKFLMTSLLVMGMIIAKAANGFPPELVLVSQPVLTYNANSVTIYYDVQNIGDYTYRGDLFIYLDPDDGYCYARTYMKICPGRIRRVSVTIPAYRPNPSWTYTVMPYYELEDELYSFTSFEYFEPVRFCWYGYRNEPWVVIHVGPRPRYYHRPGEYRYYYDGYRPMLPPPPPGGHGPHPHDMPPMDPHHHTYGYHHGHGGYPANYHPTEVTPGYNHETPSSSGAIVVRPGSNNAGSNTPGSMSSNNATNNASVNTDNTNGTSGATVRPRTDNSGRTETNGSSGTSGRTGNSGTSGRTDSSNSGNVTRPSGNTNSSGTSSSSTSGRTGNSGSSGRSNSSNSGNVSRPSGNSSSSGTSSSSSGRSNTSSSRSNSSSGNTRGTSSSSSRGTGSTGGRR